MITEQVRITSLVENTAGTSGVLAEHGLSFWLETNSQRILFDTGAGNVLSNNSEKLGVELNLVDAIILSHGHYDHTSGLAEVLNAAPHAKVFAHPDAFEPKFKRKKTGTGHYIGIPDSGSYAVRSQVTNIITTNEPTEISDGLFVTGEIPRVTTFEDHDGSFFLDEACESPDPFLDDQAMFFNTEQGTVVILGCAHAGVINTLRYIQQLTDGKSIHAVIGGMHLNQASEEQVFRTVEVFRELEVACIGPCHCTGMEATAALWSSFPNNCLWMSAGTTKTFPSIMAS